LIDPSAPELALVAAAVTLAYTVFGFSGFGANLVSLPLLVHVVSLRVAVPMLLVTDIFTATLMGLKNRSLIDRGEILRLAGWALVGMLLGTLVLSKGSEAWLLTALGSFVLLYSLYSLYAHASASPVSPRWAVPAGLVGGVFSALFGTGGPVYTLFLARRIHDTARLRATVGAIILGSALVRLAMFGAGGLLTQPGLLKLAFTMVPCAVLGYLIGSRIQARVPQALVRRVIWWLLVASGVSVLWRGLTSM
jgi:uncharacterized membrane protein YfcA